MLFKQRNWDHRSAERFHSAVPGLLAEEMKKNQWDGHSKRYLQTVISSRLRLSKVEGLVRQVGVGMPGRRLSVVQYFSPRPPRMS